MKIRIAGVINESLSNGTGLRRVYFTQGCKHNCPGCFNTETHDLTGGEDYDIDDILDDISTGIHFLDGITFSGGDPFEQPEALAELCKRIKEKYNLNIWSYTGYTFEYLLDNYDIYKDILENIDVIVDGKYDYTLKEVRFRGSSNQRIINVKQSLEQGVVVNETID